MEFPPKNGSVAFARLGKDGQEFPFESFSGNVRELLQATEEIVLLLKKRNCTDLCRERLE